MMRFAKLTNAPERFGSARTPSRFPAGVARKAGLDRLVEETLSALVPRVFSETGEKVGYSEAGDEYEAMRLKLGRAIAAAGKGK